MRMESCWSNIEAVNFVFDAWSQKTSDRILPATRSSFINANRLVGVFQADDGLVVILNQIIIDTPLMISKTDFITVVVWLFDGFLGIFLTDVLTFHTPPLSKKVLGLLPDYS